MSRALFVLHLILFCSTYVSVARYLCSFECFVSVACSVCIVFDCYVSVARSLCFAFDSFLLDLRQCRALSLFRLNVL